MYLNIPSMVKINTGTIISHHVFLFWSMWSRVVAVFATKMMREGGGGWMVLM
jgi:hypothetical protein